MTCRQLADPVPRHRPTALLALWAAFALPCSAASPILVEAIVESCADGPIRAFVARVDLRDARVEVQVTAPVEPAPDDPRGTEARLRTVPEWMDSVGAALAVNANFFARLAGSPPRWTAGQPVDVVGPSVSEGRIVSRGNPSGPGQPALLITRSRRARIACAKDGELPGVDDAVAGAYNRETGGCLLVEAGRNRGESAWPAPAARHPRTAAGLTRDRRRLILVVVDGRRSDWSVGMTLVELGALLLRLGAHDAINLDGGGSSSFLYRPAAGEPVTNRPSDGDWRPVANHLGIVLKRR